ncbi:MAG: pyrroloquinoline quinone biosynthesis protein PqqE, partial [bacterium]
MKLNGSAAEILQLCDGALNERQIWERLARDHGAPQGPVENDVRAILSDFGKRGFIEWGGSRPGADEPRDQACPVSTSLENPDRGIRALGLLAEITYRCPLHCPYCSNPVQARAEGGELDTGEWKRVLSQARGLGVMHALFSGGEPLQRGDLEALVAEAADLGFYTNLITSGVGLSDVRVRALKDAGLDSVQLSFQGEEEGLGDRIAGGPFHAMKLEAATRIRSVGLPLTVNFVLHRHNIDRLESLIGLAESLGAHRVELANAQYYGWAFENRSALLPDRGQVQRASESAERAKSRLAGRMEVVYVLPDYYSDRPKPCMNGWGRRYLTVNPFGQVLPCPNSAGIPGLTFENVRSRDLDWIWNSSDSFQRFRGFEWMPEPCRSCDRKEIDFGGCRCQAALLTGNAAVADPACALSPHHGTMEKAQYEALGAAPDFRYRRYP